MAPRYSRLANNDSEDDDTAELLLGQRPKKSRGLRFKDDTDEYIQLADMSESGPGPTDPEVLNEMRAAKVHARIERNRFGSRKIMYYVMMFIFSIVGICIWTSIYRRNHRAPPPGEVLTHPLDSSTILTNGTHQFKRTTLLISLSGMHPHYLSDMRTPFLSRFVQQHCAVPYMKPSFPSLSFPNHWTFATGLHPINHGIIGHSFYDPKLEQFFSASNLSSTKNEEFWGGEPIWETLRKQNITSAVHMWPGADAEWSENAPNEAIPFDKSEPLENKTATVIEWLDRYDIPQLMMMYVPNVDSVTHTGGIGNTETIAGCLQVDGMLQDIANAIAERNLTQVVNLVIVSDHGMAPVSNDRIVFLDDIVYNFENITSITGYPLAGLTFRTKEEAKEALHSAQRASQGNPDPRPELNETGDYPSLEMTERNADTEFKSDIYGRSDLIPRDGDHVDARDVGFSVYSSNGFPHKWHFGSGIIDEEFGENGTPKYGKYIDRLAQVYIVPEVGWSIVTHDSYDDLKQQYFYRGAHGYDNEAPLMRALFAASGPAFPPGKYLPIENVDVYTGIVRSLGGIPRNDTDGNFGLSHMHTRDLRDENYPGVDFETEAFPFSSFDDFYIKKKKQRD